MTGLPAVIVAPIDSANTGGVNQPTAGNVPALARWGDISIISGGLIVMNDATVEYGGGLVNQQGGTINQRDAINFQEVFQGRNAFVMFQQQSTNFLGTRAYITNNNFFDNEGPPSASRPTDCSPPTRCGRWSRETRSSAATSCCATTSTPCRSSPGRSPRRSTRSPSTRRRSATSTRGPTWRSTRSGT